MLMGAVGVLAMGVAQVHAEDGRVSRSALSALGLGGMRVVSDADGMQVRGMSGWAYADTFRSGRSLVVAQIVDPKTNSYMFASDTNGYFTKSKDGGTARVSGVIGEFEIEIGGHKTFEAKFFGAAGGTIGHLAN
jgi:hypothetical protein